LGLTAAANPSPPELSPVISNGCFPPHTRKPRNKSGACSY
jgi:hypothetical protein